MSLSADEQQALDSIGDKLSVSDPELASMLATFTRLTAGQDMPEREKTRTRTRSATRPSGRHRRHRLRDMPPPPAGRSRRLLIWQGASLLFGLLLAAAVVAGAIAVTHLRPG